RSQGAIQVALHEFAGAADELDLRRRLGSDPRPAAQAGAKTGALRCVWIEKEAHVLRLGTARRARRLAVDAGGADGVEEHAVEAAVAADDGVPGIGLEL